MLGQSMKLKGLLIQLGGIVLLAIVVATMTLMFSIAQPIAIIILGLFISVFLFVIILVAPEPGYKVERLAYVLLLLFTAFLVLWPRYALLRIPGLFGVSPARITLVVLLFVWVYLLFRSAAFRDRFSGLMATVTPITYSMLILFVFKFLGLFETSNLYISLKGVLNEIFTSYIIFPIALSLVTSDKHFRNLVAVLAVSGVVASILGVYESTIGHNLFLGYLEIDSEYIERNLMDKLRSGVYRIQSTFANPLTFSEFLAMLTPFLAMSVFNKPRRFVKGLVVIIVMPIFLYAIIKSGSRSGVVAFSFSVAVMMMLVVYRNARMSRDVASSGLAVIGVLLVLIFAVLAGYFLSDYVIGRTASEERSGYARIVMWARGIKIAAEQPVFGYGQDMGALVLGYVGGDQLTIDSYYLSILLENGVISLFVYCFMLGYSIYRGVCFGVSNKDVAGNSSIAIVTAIASFSAIKIILSLSHNHGILFLLMGCLFQIVSWGSLPNKANSVPKSVGDKRFLISENSSRRLSYG